MESAENTKDTELFSNSVPFASSTVRSILNGIVYANPRNTCSVLKFCNKLIRCNLFPFQRSLAKGASFHERMVEYFPMARVRITNLILLEEPSIGQ